MKSGWGLNEVTKQEKMEIIEGQASAFLTLAETVRVLGNRVKMLELEVSTLRQKHLMLRQDFSSIKRMGKR